jgi:hypothetical protein
MDLSPAPHSRSLWADLDALVLEEVDALRAGPNRPAEAPAFASEDDFVARVSAFLRGHGDPEALVERLCTDLGLFKPPRDASPATCEEPPSTAPDQTESAPPPPESSGEPAA